MGIVAVSLFVSEWDFGRRARAGRAVVVASVTYTRGGQTIAEALHVVRGEQVRATLRAWFCRLRRGQQVGILYLPDDPGDVVLDDFWQRHHGSTFALALFAVLAAREARDLADRRRRQATMLLRDDYDVPRLSLPGTPPISIDTAPRLWDRELDG